MERFALTGSAMATPMRSRLAAHARTCQLIPAIIGASSLVSESSSALGSRLSNRSTRENTSAREQGLRMKSSAPMRLT